MKEDQSTDLYIVDVQADGDRMRDARITPSRKKAVSFKETGSQCNYVGAVKREGIVRVQATVKVPLEEGVSRL